MMRAVALGREAESLQRLAIQLQHDLSVIFDEAHGLRPGEVCAVGVLVVELLGGQLMSPETTALGVLLELLRIRRAPADHVRVLTPKASKETDAGLTLVAHDVVAVGGVKWL